MKEIRLNGVVLRPTTRGWQVGEAATRKRDGKPAEHLVRIQHFAHDQLPKACGVFASRVTARGSDPVDLGALVKSALTVEQATHAEALRAPRKRKKDGPRIYVRLSPEDVSLINDAAKREGVTPTEFVRAAATDAAYGRVG